MASPVATFSAGGGALPTAVAPSPQLSKVAILLAIEKVDARLDAATSRLAALAVEVQQGQARHGPSISLPSFMWTALLDTLLGNRNLRVRSSQDAHIQDRGRVPKTS